MDALADAARSSPSSCLTRPIGTVPTTARRLAPAAECTDNETLTTKRDLPMLAREADAMFWIGRYVERAEATGPDCRRAVPFRIGRRIPRSHTPEKSTPLRCGGRSSPFPATPICLPRSTTTRRSSATYWTSSPSAAKTATPSRPVSPAPARMHAASAK